MGAQLIEELKKIKLDVDLSAVLTEIKNIEVNVKPGDAPDFQPILDEIHFNTQTIIDEIHNVNSEIGNVCSSSTASAVASANLVRDEDLEPLMAKLNDIDGNWEQMRIRLDGVDERLMNKFRSSHQESMMELQKITNLLT